MAQHPVAWHLPKLTRESCAHHELIRHFFPTVAMRQSAAAAIRTVLAKHFGKAVMLFFDDMSTVPFGEFSASVGESAVVMVVGMPPVKSRLLLQMDHDIAGFMVDRLLGGTGTRGHEPIPFSETEDGVLQYLIMQSLAELHAACGHDSPFHFRFERFLRRPAALADHLPAREPTVVMTWRVGVDQQLGIVRLAIPHQFAQEAALRTSPSSIAPAQMVQQAARFSDAAVPLWMEAGHCELSPAELASIDVGDVVVLDHADVQLQHGKPRGRVRLRVGDGTHGGVLCDLTESDTLQCRVHDVEPRG